MKTSVASCGFVVLSSIDQRRKRNSRAAADGQRLGEKQQRHGDRAQRGQKTHRVSPDRKGRAPTVEADHVSHRRQKAKMESLYVSVKKQQRQSVPSSPVATPSLIALTLPVSSKTVLRQRTKQVQFPKRIPLDSREYWFLWLLPFPLNIETAETSRYPRTLLDCSEEGNHPQVVITCSIVCSHNRKKNKKRNPD